jgi:hypothetical protein
LFRKSQFPHKFVNVSFITHHIKNTLTDLWGNYFCKTSLHNFIDTFCEIKVLSHLKNPQPGQELSMVEPVAVVWTESGTFIAEGTTLGSRAKT